MTMKSPTVRYDVDAEAIYLRFSAAEIVETVEVSDSLYVDVDANGDPIGIEVLGVASIALTNLAGIQSETELRQLLKDRGSAA